MNAKSDYWWKLQSLWISYFWFDHLDALQIKKTRVIARNATHRGVGFYSISSPSDCYMKVPSLCSSSKHSYMKKASDIYPLLTLQLHLINNRAKRVISVFSLPRVCCACACVRGNVQVCAGVCVRVYKRASGCGWLETKALGCGSLKTGQIGHTVIRSNFSFADPSRNTFCLPLFSW